jgi:hypothetical protein
MKLLLSAFKQLSVLKSFFYKNEYFASARPRIMNCSMNNYLDVKKDRTLLNI